MTVVEMRLLRRDYYKRGMLHIISLPQPAHSPAEVHDELPSPSRMRRVLVVIFFITNERCGDLEHTETSTQRQHANTTPMQTALHIINCDA